MILTAVAVVAVTAGPAVDAGPGAFTALDTYGRHWSFNGCLFPWFQLALGDGARTALAVVAVGACLWGFSRRLPPLQLWYVAGCAFVACSPTLHPWYALWAFVPGLLMGDEEWASAGAFLLGAYTVLGTVDPTNGSWTEAPWLWWITWPPALLSLAPAVARRWRASTEEPA